MKTLLAPLLILIAGFTTTAHAGQAEVEWVEPSKYTDVRPGNWGTKAKYIEHVTGKLTEQFNDLAAKRAESLKFEFKVTDLDLAGDVMVGGMNQLRVIKPVYIPRIQFSYVVKGQSGKVVAQGEEKLKDMGFDMGINRYRNEPFKYEYQMLEDWFNEQFPLD